MEYHIAYGMTTADAATNLAKWLSEDDGVHEGWRESWIDIIALRYGEPLVDGGEGSLESPTVDQYTSITVYYVFNKGPRQIGWEYGAPNLKGELTGVK